MDSDRAGGSFQRIDYFVERPAADGLSEVIRILDLDDGNNLPIYISSDEEEEGEIVVGIVGVGEGEDVPPLSSDDEDESEEEDHQDFESDEEEDEDTDDSEDWSDRTSEDSGYGSLLEDEEESEDEDNRPHSPLIQQLPPDDFWQQWRRDYPRVPVAFPQLLTVRHPLVPVQHHELPGTSASQRPEECAPSTSGLSSYTKRGREDSHWEEVTAKRLKWDCQESPDDAAPSTSGLSSSASSSREEDYRYSAPSTSGLNSSATNSRLWERPFGFPLWADDSDSD